MRKILLILAVGIINIAYAGQIESSTVQQLTHTQKVKKAKRSIKKDNINSTERYLNSSSIDIIFNGDISRLPNYLRQFDPTITVLPPLGIIKSYDVNLDLQQADLQTIQAAVSNKTGDRARLVFDSSINSLRIIYDAKVDVSKSTLQQSEIWQSGGNPKPVLGKDGLVMLPYGQYEPKIICQPLMLCDIQLQSGEIINNVLMGDTPNWTDSGDDGKSASVPIAYSGPDINKTPHIILTPNFAGLQTNLIITTTRRTYYLKLYSSNSAHVSRVGFYYPGEIMQTLAESRQAAEVKDNQTLAPSIDPQKLYFKYKLTGDDHAPFWPSQVFDDGTRVYIQMSPNMAAKSLPAIYVLDVDGETMELMNFTYKSPYYIVPKIFKQAVLKRGQDENEVLVTITRQENDPGFFSRLFGNN